jgi:phosphoesterase RecJ-like protein
MDPYKTNRLSQGILKTLSELLQVEVKDPRVGFVTLNAVELNKDHTVARVFYSVLGEDEDRTRSLAGLRKARGFLQGRLGRVLELRQVPELRFQYDDTIDRGLGVEAVLRRLEDRGEFETEADRRRRLTLAELQPPDELIAALCAGESFLIVPHWNPDPDAMGSALALGRALEAMDRQAQIVAYDDPPIGIVDLPGFGDCLPAAEVADLLRDDPPDTLVLVDCHHRDRTGFLEEPLKAITNAWCIDHHLISGRKAPLPGWVDEKACSSSTLVHQVLAVLSLGADGRCEPFELDLDMASNLYAGLFCDTGGFRFPNTLPLSFELGRRLALQGVDVSAVAKRTLYRQRRAAVELLQRALTSLEFHRDGRIATMRVDRAMLDETGAVMGDTEGFVNVVTAIEGVALVALLKELEPGLWRISLRAPGGYDVQQVAARHGGGGHRQAAGCNIQGEADEVVARLVADLAALLAEPPL